MDISESDSDYHSEVPLTMAERLARHRRPLMDYSSDASDNDSGYDRPTGRALSAPPPMRALSCGQDALVWDLFRRKVLNGVEMLFSVFENNSEEYCQEFIDGLYKEAEATVQREHPACRF